MATAQAVTARPIPGYRHRYQPGFGFGWGWGCCGPGAAGVGAISVRRVLWLRLLRRTLCCTAAATTAIPGTAYGCRGGYPYGGGGCSGRLSRRIDPGLSRRVRRRHRGGGMVAAAQRWRRRHALAAAGRRRSTALGRRIRGSTYQSEPSELLTCRGLGPDPERC